VDRKKIKAIAKDVIKHLDEMGLCPGRYFVSSKTIEDVPLLGPAQDHVDKLSNGCTVCALGACVLSYIRLFDNFDLINFRRTEYKYATLTTGGVLAGLEQIFGSNQLVLIEAAFERDRPTVGAYTSFRLHSKEIDAAIAFGKRRHSPRARAKAIMQNIIDNGAFKPEHQPKPKTAAKKPRAAAAVAK